MLRNIKDIDVEGKRVVVRVDYNVPIVDSEITDDSRIYQSLDTILYLLKKNAKIILISHLGRPNGKYDSNLSLNIVAEKISQILPSVKLEFIKGDIDDNTKIIIENSCESKIFLLENVRFNPGEESGDEEFAKNIASLGDVFINDAFSVSHRDHASVSKLAKLLPSAAGFSLAKEAKSIQEFLDSAEHPKVCIIGGAKVSTKLPLIRNILDKVDKVVLGGGVGVSFAIVANGLNAIDPFKSFSYANEILDLVNSDKIYIPEDFCGVEDDKLFIANKFNNIAGALYDIGPKSIEKIKGFISNAKTVLWNGPVGKFEDDRFTVGSLEIAKSIAINTAKNNIKSIIGGGDTIAAINSFKLNNCATYTSTSGGAFLEFLEGKKLPGLQVLED